MIETLKVEIDVNQAFALLRGLPPSALQNAWRRTLRKTANWIKSQTAKAVSKETKIPQKLLRQRLYFFLRSRDTGKVWLGLNAIEANRLGKPRQTRRGVTVGRHRFEGAWMMRQAAPDGPVYRRKGKDRMPYEMVKHDCSASRFVRVARISRRTRRLMLRQLERRSGIALRNAVDPVGPGLHHFAPLGHVFGVVVGRLRLVFLDVGELELNHLGTKSHFMQLGRGGGTEIVPRPKARSVAHVLQGAIDRRRAHHIIRPPEVREQPLAGPGNPFQVFQ